MHIMQKFILRNLYVLKSPIPQKKLEKGRVCNSERNKKVQTLKMRINHCFVAGNSFEYGNNGKVQIRKSSIHFIFGTFLTSLKKV